MAVLSPICTPRGLVLSSFAEREIWQLAPMSIPHTLFR